MDVLPHNLSIYSLNPQALSDLDPHEAVNAFRDLLWAQARRRGVRFTDIRITHEITARDGGVDAAVAEFIAAGLNDDLLTPGSRFQIKSGSCAPWQPAWVREEFFGKKQSGHCANLGQAVRRCLEGDWRYVLVCFGVDPTEEQLHQAKENFLAEFTACGYRNPEVAVWGQTQLIGLFRGFPSLCLHLAGRDLFEFRSHGAWADAHDMQGELQLDDEHSQLIEEIRTCLREDRVRHVRLIGEPGVGKSRLVLEATRAEDLAPLVVFVPDGEAFQHGPLFNALVQTDNDFFVILVIDECIRKAHGYLLSVDFSVRVQVNDTESDSDIVKAVRERRKDIESLWSCWESVRRDASKHAQKVGFLGSLLVDDLVAEHQANGTGSLPHRSSLCVKELACVE